MMNFNRKKLKQKLVQFRKNIKNNKKNIVRAILDGQIEALCIFCGTSHGLTKEHIFPRWLFNKDTKSYFLNSGNFSKNTYEKATLPVCKNCNSNILSFLESYILENLSFPYDLEDINFILLWLEIISYKFHVYDHKTKFLKNFKTNDYIPYLRDFSLAELQFDNPGKHLRQSVTRLTVKDKSKRINSFVFFKSKNNGKHFFHGINNFIFVESPKLKCAVFYFLSEDFSTEKKAFLKAMEKIKENY